ncbi:MAG: HD domain-containing protein [Candidatus Brocadiia bacterium]
MEAKLIPIVGYDDAEEIPLAPENPVVIGRADDAEIRLMQSKVSRRHCRIHFENGFYSIEDTDSKNGTWVNNRRIQKAILFHHDRITLGSTEFRFVLDSSISDETSHISVQGNGEFTFGTEIREPVETNTPSSLFLSIPKGPGQEVARELERDLSAVCKVINSVNAEQHLDRLLETVMDNVMEVSEADRGYLIAARKVNGVLMPMVGRNKESVPAAARNTFSRSIISECYEGGYSILMADPTSQDGLSESILSQQIQSVMCVPMCDQSGPVGVIYVDRIIGSEPFTERDLKILNAISNQAGIAIRRAQLTGQVESLFRDAIRTVINMLEQRDEYTYGHSERVTAVALLVAELCEIPKAERRHLEVAGLLHDVGKLAVDLEILQKPTSLSESEYQTIQEHPVAGANILRDVENAEMITDAVRHHHEWWDGSGYPDGLAGEEIMPLARILALADAFDSMASDRPYKKALPIEGILSELRGGRGTQFAPYLVDTVVAALEGEEEFQRRIAEVYRRKGQEPQPAGPFNWDRAKRTDLLL